MTTSLVQQLRKLAVPESSIYKEQKKKASLLFDPKEAASLDRETFYEIGLSGFTELKNIDSSFAPFESSLFSISSKEFVRAIQTKDANEKLNRTIKSFLLKLSPYLLLQPTHKALEWLINRFHIHKYNKNEVLSLILPYHETKLFIRFIQIMKISDSDFWHWLQVLQKPGIPLTKIVLYNHCISNVKFLHFITDMIKNTVEEYGDRAEILTTLFAFYCSTIVGTLENTSIVTEPILTNIMPGLLYCLSSPLIDLRSAGYIITAQLVSKVQLKKKLVNHLINNIVLFDSDLSYEAVLLLHIIFETQSSITTLSQECLINLTPKHIEMLCIKIAALVENGVNINKLLLALFNGVLPLIQKNNEYFRIFSALPEALISEIKVDSDLAKKIIKCAIDCYSNSNSNITEGSSDIEMIEDENTETLNVQTWYMHFIRKIEQKYPMEFDNVFKNEVKFKEQNSVEKYSNDSLWNGILGFIPKFTKKLGNTYLFEKLYHHNPYMRIEAVNYLTSNYKTMLKSDRTFFIESILNRLDDTDPRVVSSVLSLELKKFLEIVPMETFCNYLKKIIERGQLSREWRKTGCFALELLCTFNLDELQDPVYLFLVPYFFPLSEDEIKTMHNILKSKIGQDLFTNEDIMKILNITSPNTICKLMFNIIKKSKWIPNVSRIIEIIKSIKYDNHIMTFFLFLLLAFKLAEHNECSENILILRDIINIMKDYKSSVIDDFSLVSCGTIVIFVKHNRENKLPLESSIYVLQQIIQNTKLSNVKAWIDFNDKSLDTEFIITVYGIFDNNFKKCTKLYKCILKELTSTLFLNLKQKVIFIASMINGYCSTISKHKSVDEVNTILIRSMRIFHALLEKHRNASWIYDSDVLIACFLMNLNSSEIAIRKMAIDIINVVINKFPSANKYYTLLQEFSSRKEELEMDCSQASLVMYNLLSPQHTIQKTLVKSIRNPMRDARSSLINIILNDSTPFHIKQKMLSLLEYVNSKEILIALSPLGRDIIFDCDSEGVIDVYKSHTLRHIISRIDAVTFCVESDNLWQFIAAAFKNLDLLLVDDGGNFQNVCTLMMKQFTSDLFFILPLMKAQTIISFIVYSGAFGVNPSIISTASKVMKKININAEHILPILIEMENVCERDKGKSTKKKKITTPSFAALNTQEWKMGLVLLEYMQNKKNVDNVHKILPALLHVLKQCIDFEEQSVVEYPKQLLLTSILECCKYSRDDNIENFIKKTIDIELIILCIRGTHNPQTHHHALMLLSHIAYMLPDQVLQYMMAIFTFIGSSVLRQDDAYSFQIITKIIETVIPILIKTDKLAELNNKTESIVEPNVIPVLRIFVDAVLDIPKHRRLPLFKKLLMTLSAQHFLWIFLALMFESHVVHAETENKSEEQKKLNDYKEDPIKRLDFAMLLIFEFSPEIILQNCNKLLHYLLHIIKDNPELSRCQNEIFIISTHTAKQFRHFKYVIITFINGALSSANLVTNVKSIGWNNKFETSLTLCFQNILSIIGLVSRSVDLNIGKPQAKYWKVMLHHCYEALDNIFNLIETEAFISLIEHSISLSDQFLMQRKILEILNTRLQQQTLVIDQAVMKCLLHLVDGKIMDIIKSIKNNCLTESENTDNSHELELNQQTALLSLKLITRSICMYEINSHYINIKFFQNILNTITTLLKCANINNNVMASLVLCLAELCSNLKAHAIGSLPEFMPPLIKILKIHAKVMTAELILLSVITATSKIIETIPLFLSPYLVKLLYYISVLSAKWQQSNNSNSPVVNKLVLISEKISTTISPRVLIPIVSQCYDQILKKNNFEAIGPAMIILANSFSNITGPEFSSLQQDLTAFFLSALQFKTDHVHIDKISSDKIDVIEGQIIKALVALVLKLSESSFRPLYYKIYDWSVRNFGSEYKYRAMTFYRLSSHIAENLHGLFVLFAGHFVKNACDLLNMCNKNRTNELYFEDEAECSILIKYILNTLTLLFTYDNQNFINKEKFETIMQPLVDQLDNLVDGIDALKSRCYKIIIPCIAQFAIATADDSLWKPLNYQIMLKTKNNDPEIRLLGLECMREMASKLGDSWLPLLPESIPFLAELLEDDVLSVESAAQKAIQTLESVLGEPLQKYF